MELRDHFGDPASDGQSAPLADARSEARAALLALDYKPAEVAALLDAVGEGGTQTTEELVRAALRRAVLR